MAKKIVKNFPPNFTDLRNSPQPHSSLLIQDVWNSATAQRFRLLSKTWQLVAGACILIFFGLTFVLVRHHGHPTYYFPESIRTSVHFQLYYPTKLPQGLQVVPGSIKGNEQAVLYTIADEHGHKFYVSIQRLPNNFDYETFKNKFTDTDETLVNIGSALTGDAGYALIGSVRTANNSWILINTPDTTLSGELQGLTHDFEKAT